MVAGIGAVQVPAVDASGQQTTPICRPERQRNGRRGFLVMAGSFHESRQAQRRVAPEGGHSYVSDIYGGSNVTLEVAEGGVGQTNLEGTRYAKEIGCHREPLLSRKPRQNGCRRSARRTC